MIYLGLFPFYVKYILVLCNERNVAVVYVEFYSVLYVKWEDSVILILTKKRDNDNITLLC